MIPKKYSLILILFMSSFINISCVYENPKTKEVGNDIDFIKEKILMLESKNEILKTNIEIQKIKIDSLENKVKSYNSILIENNLKIENIISKTKVNN